MIRNCIRKVLHQLELLIRNWILVLKIKEILERLGWTIIGKLELLREHLMRISTKRNLHL